jgi:pimeloyl-ACP methyl ester carboxylesterase
VAFSTAQVIDLASRGWVVVTFDHPHDTYVVEQPDGTLIFSTPPDGEPDIERYFTERVVDVGVVLHNLRLLVPEAHRRAPVGMFGHSLGGAAAAEALLLHPRLRAGVDLDGTPFGRVVHEGLDEPFGIMLSTTHGQPGQVDVNLERFIANLRGPHPIRRLDIGHNGFTDFVVLNPQAMLVDPALGAQLEAIFAIGVGSVAEGTAALAAQRRFLARFMGRHLRRCHGGAQRDAPAPADAARGSHTGC